MAILKKEELFVIVTDWRSPFEDLVYTDFDEAQRLADEYNKEKGYFKKQIDGIIHQSGSYAEVLNIYDYVSKERDSAADNANYN